jgi:hypothetical protein
MVGLSTAERITANLTAEEIGLRLSHAHGHNGASPRGYRAVRKYVLNNSRFHQHAEMHVQVRVHYPNQKQFDITSASGPEWMIGVLRNLLTSEEAAAKTESSRLGPHNYTFRLLGKASVFGLDCYLLEIAPRFEGRFMLRGLVWVDMKDFIVVRFEGRTESKVSSWVGRPFITQTFQRVGPVWVPANTHSVANSHLFGNTELSVTSFDYVLVKSEHDEIGADGSR